MLKGLRLALPLLLIGLSSYAQVINPGEGDVSTKANNIYTPASFNDFSNSAGIIPYQVFTSDPTGNTCTNAAAFAEFSNKLFICSDGHWTQASGGSFSGLSGDVFATSDGNSTVQKLRGIPLSTATPTGNQFLQYDATSGTWLPQTLILAGDASGIYSSVVVGKLQGTPLNIQGVTPADHLALVWDNATQRIVWGAPSTSQVTMTGDVTGASSNNTLTSLQGHAISANSPLSNQFLAYNGSQWVPTTISPTTSVTLAGDVTGNSGSNVLAKLLGVGLSGTPAEGQILKVVGGVWTPTDPASVSSVTMGGDVNGNSATSSVVALQGHAVSGTAPTGNQLLSWTGSWTPTSVGGDLSGAISSLVVNSLQGKALDLTAAATNYVLTYNGTKFIMAPQASSPTHYAMTGDVTGFTDGSTVAKIQGKAVAATAPSNQQVMTWSTGDNQWEPAAPNSNATALQTKAVSATAPTDKQVLTWNATDSAWEPTTPVAATFVTMAGDVTGNSNASVVAALQGIPVVSTAPALNQILIFNGTSWAPTAIPTQNPALGGDLTHNASNALVASLQGFGLTLTSPVANQAIMWNGSQLVFGNPTASATTVPMTGDVSGTSDANVVSKIQGHPVASTAPSADGQFMTWNGTLSQWEPKTYTPPAPPASYTLTGDVTGTTLASVLSKIGGIPIAAGTPSNGYALLFNGTSLTWSNPQASANAVEIQGFNVINTAPTDGQALVWNATDAKYEPKVVISSAAGITLAGDVTGAGNTNTVTKIQNKAVSSVAPINNQVLRYRTSSTSYVAYSPLEADDYLLPSDQTNVGGPSSNWQNNALSTNPSVSQNNAVAPDGNTTASLYTLGTSGQTTYCGAGVLCGGSFIQVSGDNIVGQYTFSIWAKGGTASSIVLAAGQNGSASEFAYQIFPLTTQWQKYSFTFASTLTASTFNPNFFIVGSAAGQTAWVWGGSLTPATILAAGANANEIQSIPVSTTPPTTNQYLAYSGTQYVPTTLVDSGFAGLDSNFINQALGNNSAATNLFVNSVQFGGTSWGNNGAGASVVLNAATGPDGSTTATKFICGTGGNSGYDQSFTTSAAGLYTISVWAKAGTYNVLTIGFYQDGIGFLSTKNFTLSSTWQRYSYTFPVGASASFHPNFIFGSSTSAANNIYMWGPQVVFGPTAGQYTATTTTTVSTPNLIAPLAGPGLAYVQTATATASGTSASSLIGTGSGTLSIASLSQYAGKTLHIRAGGTINAAASSNPTLTLSFAGTTIGTVTLSSLSTGANSYNLDATITIATTGSTGTMYAQGFVNVGGSGAATSMVFNNSSSLAIDTTATESLALTGSVSAAGTTITSTNLVFTAVN